MTLSMEAFNLNAVLLHVHGFVPLVASYLWRTYSLQDAQMLDENKKRQGPWPHGSCILVRETDIP